MNTILYVILHNPMLLYTQWRYMHALLAVWEYSAASLRTNSSLEHLPESVHAAPSHSRRNQPTCLPQQPIAHCQDVCPMAIGYAESVAWTISTLRNTRNSADHAQSQRSESHSAPAVSDAPRHNLNTAVGEGCACGCLSSD